MSYQIVTDGSVSDTRRSSIFEGLIKPAILNLLAETEGEYRCERDLHHHLTICFQEVTPLHLGTRKKLVSMEEPGIACYGSGRRGNLDYFLLGTEGHGAAVELNFNYDSTGKIIKDIQKLIDPESAYQEAVYFAFGRKKMVWQRDQGRHRESAFLLCGRCS